MRSSQFALALFLLTCPSLQSVSRADLMAGSTSSLAVADQTVRITDPSPLNGPPFNIPGGAEFDLSATGSFTFGWDAEAGGTANFSSFSASFSENHPVLGPYNLLATGSGPGAGVSGQLTNIVDAAGSLVSADFSVSTTFSLTFLAPGLGMPTLYTQDQGTFTGVVDDSGSVGSVFTSLGDLDVFFANPAGPDPLAAVSFNRTVTAVPEPSSFLLCGVVGILAVRRCAKKRRRTDASNGGF